MSNFSELDSDRQQIARLTDVVSPPKFVQSARAGTMRVIWKTVLRLVDVQEVQIPVGAEIICAREQFEVVCIWYRCDSSAPLGARTIAIIGTGHPCPAVDGRYLGTASLRGGQLMFHVFEREEMRA